MEQTKKRVGSFFHDSVKGRLELRSTNYRGAHDEEGRGYITFDKREVWSMCTLSKESDKVREFFHIRCECEGLELSPAEA